MTESFNISTLFKRYIRSLDSDLYYVFKLICIGKDYDLDDYCLELERCMENSTTYSYAILIWSPKTAYLRKGENQRTTGQISVNNITYPMGAPEHTISYINADNSSLVADVLNRAYYQLLNTIDDSVSIAVYSECKPALQRQYQYTLYDLFRNGCSVFLMLPSGNKDRGANETIREYYERKYSIDICDDMFTCTFSKLCNGWYKFFLETVGVIPERRVMCIYKDKITARLSCRQAVNTTLSEKRIPPKNVTLTMHYECDRS